jgi:hypothetical protein
MSEKEAARWASEAFALLRLFERTRASAIGLLLLLMGWTGLLLLVAGLCGDGDAAPALAITVPPGLGSVSVALTDLLVYGAITITAGWLVTARLLLLLSLPLARLVRWLALPVGFALLLPLGLADGVIVLTCVLPLKAWNTRMWKRRYPEEARLLAAHCQSQQELTAKVAIRARLLTADQYLSRGLRARMGAQLRSMVSAAHVGLSPLYGYTLQEEQKSAKAPRQVFAEAIARVRNRWQRWPSARHARFVVLPFLPRVDTDDTARALRRWLGLDVLLWGSYLSADPPRLWLNLQHATVEPRGLLHGERDGGSGDVNTTPSEHHLFLTNEDEMVPASLVMDQDDPLDARIVLTCALLHVSRLRDARPRWLQAFDELARVNRARLKNDLFMSVLFSLTAPLSRGSALLEAKSALVSLASAHVGASLYHGRDPAAQGSLLAIAEACAALEPWRPEHHYRLGALLGSAGDDEGALAAFSRAAQQAPTPSLSSSYEEAFATFLIEDRMLVSDQTKRAMAAAAAARAIASCRGPRVRQDLAERFMATAAFRYYESPTLLHRLLGRT